MAGIACKRRRGDRHRSGSTHLAEGRRPGSIVVEARFKFHLPENQVRRLQFAADPRLHLLPFEGKDPPNVRIRADGAKQQVITLQWNRPLDEETTVDLTFLFTGASGVGKFRLPQIEPLGAGDPTLAGRIGRSHIGI